ncbi:MAG TPA: crosslink repair DNA glycosylase YcaQ family protein, partial [Ignavibacteria bacterium]
WGAWSKKNKKVIQYVIDRIMEEGPLQSRDFEHPKKRGTWWDWKPTKHALEYLFHTGALMVRARKSFHKVYDLTERILPTDIITSEPTDEEHSEHLILSAIRANGIVTKNEITYQKYYAPAQFEKTLNHLFNEKQIVRVKVENHKEEYYSTEKELDRLNHEILPAINRCQELIHILSPFDNLIIQRKRLKNLFDFDYVIECYLPAHKRKFGYFCLPVLYGDKFIGRIDAKADRANNNFIVSNFFTENGFKKNVKSNTSIKRKIKELAEFAGCNNITHI